MEEISLLRVKHFNVEFFFFSGIVFLHIPGGRQISLLYIYFWEKCVAELARCLMYFCFEMCGKQISVWTEKLKNVIVPKMVGHFVYKMTQIETFPQINQGKLQMLCWRFDFKVVTLFSCGCFFSSIWSAWVVPTEG